MRDYFYTVEERFLRYVQMTQLLDILPIQL